MKRLLFWFCFLLIAPLQSALAVIAIDNTSSDFFSNSSSLTISHTTGSNSDRFMLVGVSFWNEDFETVSTVTYGGTALTRIGSVQNSDDSRVEIWKLLNPSAGPANVVISFSSRVQKGAGAGVMTFSGVDQSDPHDTFQSDTGESGQASITISSAINDLVFAVAASENQDDPFDIDEGTERWNVKVNGNNKLAGAGGTRAGAASTEIAWDIDDSDDWAIAGVSINPSSVVTPLPSPRLEHRFDECSLASGVTDSAGFYDGTANNVDSTDDESLINRSLDLSDTGTSDWVTLLQSSVDSLNDFSISVWVKVAGSKSQQEIFQALGSSTGDDEIEIYLVNSNQVQMNVGDSGASVSAGKTLTDNVWHHLVVTRSGSQMCLYVDGSLSGCHTSGGSGQVDITNASAVVLGQEQDAFGGSFDSAQSFDGYIDEFKIYSANLDSTHVGQIYTNESNGLNADGTTRSAVVCTSVVPAPIAEYRMDETAWSGLSGEVKDSANSYDGTAFVTSTTEGKVCRAADLSAQGTADYLSLDGSFFADQGDFTISSWVKTSKTSNQSLVSGANSSSFNELIFWLTSSTNFQPHLNNSSIANLTIDPYADGLWHHLVWVRTGTQNCLYIDKDLQGCLTANSTNINIASNGLIVGQEQDTLGGGFVSSQGWEGLIDELIFFDEALTATDIENVFDLQDDGKNLDGTDRECEDIAVNVVADWRFDETAWGGTNDVLDSSGNDYHGSAIVATPDSGDAQLCNSVDLTATGTTDYLSMNKDAMDGLSDFTVIVWAKTTATQDSTILSVASADSGLGANEAVFYFEDNNRFWPTITSASFQTNTKLSSTTPSMRDGDWHQLAWTRKASTAQSCFLFDGVSQGCVTHTDGDDTSPLSVLSGGLIIGQDQDGLGDGFDGSQDWEGHLDEFLIFDSVLSESQISTIRTNITNSNNWDGTPRVCGAAIDHYSINHDGEGVTCLLENITISAHDSGHNAVDAESKTVNLSTTSSKGDWVGVISGATGLNNGTPGNGAASFTFSAGATDAVLTFAYPILSGDPETLGFNVSDGLVSEQSGSATTVLDDPSITYSLAGFRFIDSSGNTVIPTQISGKASDLAPGADTLYLQAVKASDSDPNACVAALSGTKTIQLAAQCDNPSDCVVGQTFNAKSGSNAAVNLALNSSSPVTPSSYSAINMTFDGEAKAPLILNYSDAGLMQLHASFTVPETSAVLTGASNQFVVRPFAFGFPSIVAGAVSNPAGDEVGPSNATGFVSAGSDFTPSLNAYRYQSSDDSNSDGVPDDGADVTNNGVTPNFTGSLDIAVNSYTPAAGVAGSLSGDATLLLETYVNRSGADVPATLQYDEVGSVSLIASMNNYLADANADITSVPVKVGRFYPDHFILVDSDTTAACNSFTYMQQPFGLSYEVEARPKGATNGMSDAERITQNYSESLSYASTAVMLGESENNNSGDDLSSRFSGYLADDEWVLGVYSADRSDAIFTRDPSETGLEDGPFDNLQLGIRVDTELDNRGFADSELNMKPDDNNDCSADGDCTSVAIGNEQVLRYGRLQIQSAHGPESDDIAVPFAAQYWDGTRFITSIDDNCTAFPLSRISFDGVAISSVVADRTVAVGDGTTVGTLNTSGTDAEAVSGEFSLVFSAPGIAAAGSDNTGYFPVEVINIDDWLRYDWDQDGSAGDSSLPDAVITFGRARGNDRMIFWQERYQ